MNAELKTKQIHQRGTRHRNECYHAVIDSTPGSTAIAYLRVINNREELVLQLSPDTDGIVLSRGTYILNPHFAGGYLFWVENDGNDWTIKAVDLQKPVADEIIQPFSHHGRPLSLSSATGGCGTVILSWEERQGKTTRIRYARFGESRFEKPVELTDGTVNAYDPAVAITPDGTAYIAYTAFIDGDYQIMLQEIRRRGSKDMKPIVISNRHCSCLYPSLAPRKQGGVWFSYTSLILPSGEEELFQPFVTHHRHLAQLTFFSNHGLLFAGYFDGRELLAPFAPPAPGILASTGELAGMIVFGSGHCGRSTIFEDQLERAHILFRQHNQAAPVTFTEEGEELCRSEKRGVEKSGNRHPDICLTSLEDEYWSIPRRLIQHAHFDSQPTFNLNGKLLNIAFTEDGRSTGFSQLGGAEWSDHTSEIGVGTVSVELRDTSPPAYKFYPFTVKPMPVASMEEPRFDHRQGSVIHAIGQTHTHSNLSVCRRETDRDITANYRFFQDVTHCDFCATTDHGFNMWQTEMLWMRKLAEYYYFPGEFVAIPAYEWTGTPEAAVNHDGGPFGHLNVLWLEEEGDLAVFTPMDKACAGGNPVKLRQVYEGRKIVAIPHHIKDSHWYNWNFFNEEFSPIIEIFQEFRGSAEQPKVPGISNSFQVEEGAYAVDKLREGRKFGFIAGADHSGLALAGVPVAELTRSALYDAVTERRTFGTTGIAVSIEFNCNGQDMGSSVKCERADFSISVRGAATIAELQVVRNGDEVEIMKVNQKEFARSWTAEQIENNEFWYCRLIFENGEIAWSSPIWLGKP